MHVGNFQKPNNNVNYNIGIAILLLAVSSINTNSTNNLKNYGCWHAIASPFSCAGFISKEFRYLTFASKAEINAASLSNQLVSSNSFIIYLK